MGNAARYVLMTSLPCLLLILTATIDPFADAVVDFQAGTGGAAGYDDPTTAIGSPSRLTVDDEVVSPFVPAWGPDDIVSIGAGGSLTLSFDEPIADHPDNPYGIDLLIFGNAGCIDTSYPGGVVGGFFGVDGGIVEVSEDGILWHRVEGVTADAPWPTMGYVDTPAYTFEPGLVPTSFVRPVDPAIDPTDADGLDYEAMVDLYDRSGGGVGIDLAPLALDSITFIRISVPSDAFFAPEVDAVADVAPRYAGDVTLDGFVGITDLLEVLAAWGQIGQHPADIDSSGQVDIGDLLLVLTDWGSQPW